MTTLGAPASLPAPPLARPTQARNRLRRGSVLARVLFHLAFALSFGVGCGALIVWPQWVAMDGSRSALGIQQARAEELQQRLDTARAMMGRLRLWDDSNRRVFLREEAHQLARLVRSVSARYGLRTERFSLSRRQARRWPSLTLESNADGTSGGQVASRSVHMVLTGPFESVFNAVSALCEQQLLFLPERWALFPVSPVPGEAHGDVRVELMATIFVIEEPEGSGPSLYLPPDAAEDTE